MDVSRTEEKDWPRYIGFGSVNRKLQVTGVTSIIVASSPAGQVKVGQVKHEKTKDKMANFSYKFAFVIR